MPKVVPNVTPFKRILLGHHRRPFESYVRLRPEVASEVAAAEAREVLDALGEDLARLSVRLESLELGLLGVANDRSACAAAETALARSREIAHVIEFLFVVQAMASAAPAPLLIADGPLADYLRGVVAWCSGVLRAFEQLAVELKGHAPDWKGLRRRLHDASTFLLGQLVRPIRDDFECVTRERSNNELDELRTKLEELFAETDVVSVSLQRRFG